MLYKLFCKNNDFSLFWGIKVLARKTQHLLPCKIDLKVEYSIEVNIKYHLHFRLNGLFGLMIFQGAFNTFELISWFTEG